MTTNRRVYEFIKANPGTTSVQVAEHLNVRHPIYGMQRAGSSVIAALRRNGYVEDCRRCETCRRALTRRDRNVPLYVTDKEWR